MNHRRLSSWLLVGVAIFVVLGHICAEPIHAHAGAVTTHSDEHQHDGEGDEAAHAGSCEVRRADFTVYVPTLLPSGLVVLVASVLASYHAQPVRVPVPASSPPLFLLHAALLI